MRTACLGGLAGGLWALVFACGGDGGGLPGDVHELSIVVDVSMDGATPSDSFSPSDTGVDVAPLVDPGFEAEIGTELDVMDAMDAMAECPGGYQCPCTNHGQCFDGFCVETMDGGRCSRPCTSAESCPAGWRCATTPMGGDPFSVCMAPAVQCRPCRTNEDCVRVPWGPNVCVSRGATGSFCAVSCSKDSRCTDGFVCARIEQAEEAFDVCVPADGEPCPCTSWFVDQHYTTECYTTGDPSVCRGTRTCDAACEFVAVPETCDGLDNDCDGETDDGCDDDADDFCDAAMGITGPPWPGVCPSGGLDCDDSQTLVNPGAVEACNGRDEDCDGRTDNAVGSSDPLTSGPLQDHACLEQGVCRAGVPRLCVDGQWDCHYKAVTLYQNPEAGCEDLDNDCDGCTDEGLGMDAREPGNDVFNGSSTVFGVTMTDCNGSSANVVPSMTLHRNPTGCARDIDWFQFDYQDRGTCIDNAISVTFTSNVMNYGICAYFKCKEGRLQKFKCDPGTKVMDGPVAVDPGGFGCCCTGGNCKVGISSSTMVGGPDCDDGTNDDGKVYVKVWSTGATSCTSTYSFNVWGD